MKTDCFKFGLVLWIVWFVTTGNSFAQSTPGKIAIVIHGGAGAIQKSNMTPENEKDYLKKLEEARDAGYNILKEGGIASEAVVAAIVILEDSPLFNAGKGAVLTNTGTNELDASIMDGKSKNAGAVAGVKKIKNPIKGAQLVMEDSPHVMLSGDGGDEYAKEKGLEMVEADYFKTEKREKQLQKVKQKDVKELDDGGKGYFSPSRQEFDPANDYKYGTVGCVALDVNGNLAAGTSTGGMTNKRWGRIGDSPIIGAGTYADNNTCGVSCTGHGEFFIRNSVAHDISSGMEYGKMDITTAVENSLDKVAQMGGTGGAICIDKEGNIEMMFNTSGMFRAYINVKGEKFVGIYR